MLNDNVTAIESREQFSDDLTALLRDKAQDLLRAALEAEVANSMHAQIPALRYCDASLGATN